MHLWVAHCQLQSERMPATTTANHTVHHDVMLAPSTQYTKGARAHLAAISKYYSCSTARAQAAA